MATAAQIIERLGGPAELARETGFPLTTIASWGDANYIPEWRREKLIDLGKARTPPVKLKASDFPTPDQRISRTKPAEQGMAA